MASRRTLPTELLLVTMAGLPIAAGCGADSGMAGNPGSAAPSQEGSPVFPEPTHPVAALDCGTPFRPPAESSLTVTGHFPAVTSADARLLSGTVEVAGREDLHGVTTPRADVFLVRDGVLVTVPAAQDSIGMRWDVAAGETQNLPGDAVLDSCAPEGLAPGSYEVFARVVLNSDDGATVEFFGGPWPLEVR